MVLKENLPQADVKNGEEDLHGEESYREHMEVAEDPKRKLENIVDDEVDDGHPKEHLDVDLLVDLANKLEVHHDDVVKNVDGYEEHAGLKRFEDVEDVDVDLNLFAFVVNSSKLPLAISLAYEHKCEGKLGRADDAYAGGADDQITRVDKG